MFIISGNSDKRHYIWDHMKKHHTGDRVAVIGYKNKLPQTLLRNKQVPFYESLHSPETMVADCEAFLKKFKDQYEGLVLYVDCTEEQAYELEELAKSYPTRLSITVQDEGQLATKEVLEKIAA